MQLTNEACTIKHFSFSEELRLHYHLRCVYYRHGQKTVYNEPHYCFQIDILTAMNNPFNKQLPSDQEVYSYSYQPVMLKSL